ncbi:hypothetical protein E3O62_13005 [Cryobacterium sp. TMT2-15-1]|uniref:proton-conducting transporter transmembrane domain-containing protein n=1 Tax=Cryobacterium sp. TMT2-15-1 TaxID=1259246 RepID=UPI00106A7109|nr:proton-conducting transporter membrane subunit [Cryobacterium sp. TMT2-15-1]TFC56376.1 hypothetical protein E3O62_13005 [Cryobacterium sp. TMT2-15-1]
MNENVTVAMVLAGPWVAVLASAIAGRLGRSGELVARIAAAVVSLGFVFTAAVAVAVSTLWTGSIQVGFGETSVQLDTLALIMSMLVLGLSSLIQGFAVRYLRGDPRQIWFVVTANLLTGFTVLMVCAGSVALFACAWVGAGAALVLLLATYWPLAQAREGVWRTVVRFGAADTAFLLAVAVLLVGAGGDLSFDQLGAGASGLSAPAQLTLAVLLVLAALARSSQIPFQGWLPFTLGAPTPVSALLHAGVVNAGAILLLRFAPAIAPHRSVMIVVCVVGAATLVFASAVRLARPDVKGRLVFSTMAQMGFMIMACGLGLFAAAIFHLVAHSLYKSTLFLGAGTGVRQHATDRDLPTRTAPSRLVAGLAVAISVTVTVAVLVAAKLVLSPAVSPSSIGLLAFVALTAGVTLAVALATHFSIRTTVVGTTVTAAVGIGYVAFLHLFTGALEPGVPVQGAPGWLLVLPAVGLIAVELLARSSTGAVWLRDRVYTSALAASLPRNPIRTGAPL